LPRWALSETPPTASAVRPIAVAISVRVTSCRAESAETYVIAKGFRGGA